MHKVLLAVAVTFFVAACAGPSVPDQPPELVAPPPVATSGFETAYAEETIPMSLPQLRRFMERQPLITFLEPTESISNPVESQVLQGEWAQPGAVRWLRLADGHYVVERVIENRPDFFKYQVFVFTNAAGAGVEQIVGEQRFVPVENGTRMEWTYNVRPKNALTRIFVKQNLPEVDGYITNGLRAFADAARAAAG